MLSNERCCATLLDRDFYHRDHREGQTPPSTNVTIESFASSIDDFRIELEEDDRLSR